MDLSSITFGLLAAMSTMSPLFSSQSRFPSMLTLWPHQIICPFSAHFLWNIFFENCTNINQVPLFFPEVIQQYSLLTVVSLFHCFLPLFTSFLHFFMVFYRFSRFLSRFSLFSVQVFFFFTVFLLFSLFFSLFYRYLFYCYLLHCSSVLQFLSAFHCFSFILFFCFTAFLLFFHSGTSLQLSLR